jgi:DNA-binding CsgD family transcriptional regulator
MKFDIGTLEGHENAAKRQPSGTNAARTFENPIVRGLREISSVPAPENARPTFNSTLLETFAKFHSPSLVATEQHKPSATPGKASTRKRIADGLRPLEGSLRSPEASLRPLGTPMQQVDHLYFVHHQRAPGRSVIKLESWAQQTDALTPLANTAMRRIVGIPRTPSFLVITQHTKFGTFTGLVGQWPQDPYGELVPGWNVELYRLAQAAYEDDYLATVQFLDEIGADYSADNVLFIQDLLGPTFDPKRLDRRDKWEQREPADARRWLRKRLGEHRSGGKDKHELPYDENPDEENTGPALITPSMLAELMNPDGDWDRKPTHVNGATPSAMAEFMKQERVRSLSRQLQAMLPERQYQVLLCLAEGMIYKEIAYRLGIGVSTVKTHVRYLRQKPDLKALLAS